MIWLRRIIFVVIASVFIVLVGFYAYRSYQTYLPEVVVGDLSITSAIFSDGTHVQLDYAETDEQQRLGLGYRERLAEDVGMLFTYEEPAILSFWMKGMNFPIDIIWLLNGQIVDISHNVPTELIPHTTYSPKTAANQVIEVNAGFSAQHGLKIGDSVDIFLKNL